MIANIMRRLIRWHIDTAEIPYHREMIPRHVRHAVIRRDGTTCRYCGVRTVSNIRWRNMHLDHVYPSSKGGETTAANLVVSCRRCNLKKSARVGVWPKPVGWYTLRGKAARFILKLFKL